MALMELKETCMELSPKFSIRKGVVQGENFEEGVESEQRVKNLTLGVNRTQTITLLTSKSC
jgi:hypothetical protein